MATVSKSAQHPFVSVPAWTRQVHGYGYVCRCGYWGKTGASRRVHERRGCQREKCERLCFGIWPNGNHCGSIKDEDVEFIRISKDQHGIKWEDPRKT